MQDERLFMHFPLSVRKIFRMEAHMIIEAIKNEKMFSDAASAFEQYLQRLCKALWGVIGETV